MRHVHTGGRATIGRLLQPCGMIAGLFLALQVSSVNGQSGPPGRQVALTFDDLPISGARCDTARVGYVTRRITATLRTRALPSTGLVTPAVQCTTPGMLAAALAQWQAAGALIGNHSATHPDYNATPVAAYLANIERAQALIDAAVATDERWFRAPQLHTGDTPAKKQALSAYLAEQGYRVAPVSVDNQEWVYAAVYADLRARDDRAAAERVVDAYIDHLAESMAYYERLSVAVFGREIPQVLLLHANLLNAEQLERVLAMLQERGYAFISMPYALRDPAYAREDTYVGERGLSWLQRWARADGIAIPPEPREAAWIAEAFRRR